MTREQAKEYVKAQLDNYLQGKGINTRKNFPCLICGKGHKTPNMGYKNDRIHCFACGADMDIIELIGHETGKSGANLFNYCYDYFRITIDDTADRKKSQPQSRQAEQPPSQSSVKDYTLYVMKCKTHVDETDYLTRRGLSPSIISRYNLGYDPEKKVIIIPYSGENTYYITRSIEGKTYYKLKTEEAGAEPIYNVHALYNHANKPVFIVEGVFDALSIIEAGAEAIALNGTGYARLIEKLIAQATQNPLIICLDNDNAGQTAENEIYEALQKINAICIKVNVCGEHKDPNEALTARRDLFLKAVQDANAEAIQYAQEVEAMREAEQAAEREQYINATSVTAHIDDFLGNIKNSVNTPAIPTNFPELDKVLDDGLYEGLYILGAISSLGKTSFVLQIADQIAQQGQDVLIFSLEMAKTELMAKSISRITFLECGGKTNHAKTTRGITSGKRHANYSGEEKALINKSINLYATYTDYLYVYEGMGDIGAAQIRETAERHIKLTGHKPVIVIDYLQILAPFDMRATDKQNTDKSIFELKRLSRDFKIPVIGISSLNRENYNANISMAAFKESGAIEYSSDVLIGLQFEAVSGASDENNTKITAESIDRFKRKEPRKIELRILKNRNGATGDTITYDYYPKFNLFNETGRKNNDDTRAASGSARGNNKR